MRILHIVYMIAVSFGMLQLPQKMLLENMFKMVTVISTNMPARSTTFKEAESDVFAEPAI